MSVKLYYASMHIDLGNILSNFAAKIRLRFWIILLFWKLRCVVKTNISNFLAVAHVKKHVQSYGHELRQINYGHLRIQWQCVVCIVVIPLMSIEIRVRQLRNACLTSNLSIVLWNLFQLQAAGGGERRSFEGGKFELLLVLSLWLYHLLSS